MAEQSEENPSESQIIKINKNFWEFPHSSVVRTQHFHCQTQVQSLVQELRSHKPHGMAKRKKLLHSKVNSKQNEKAAYRLGENTCKSYT